LACAIKKTGDFNLIFAGRQAIDGDTAQVGPQVSEKLGIPQITYAEEIVSLKENNIRIKRRLDRGYEVVESTLPALITVHGTAPDCRPRNAKRLMKYKLASTLSEKHQESDDYLAIHAEKPYLTITEWCAKDVNCNLTDLGLAGSPTKVRQVENIVFQAKDSKMYTNNNEEIESLMQELINNHTIG
jgi:electron transfer flavoprotein beta subunit